MEANNRYQSLDFLRGLAILLVLMYHYELFFITARMGWIGVDLFFVLSGFLIALLLIKEYKATGTVNLHRFYIRRLFKTLPVFYCAVATDIAYFLYKGVEVKKENIVNELLFVQNYRPSISGVTWSLALEEHFYVLIGLAASVLVFKKVSTPFLWIVRVCVTVMIVCLLLRLVNNLWLTKWSLLTHQWPTHLRMDSLAAGVLLACCYSAKKLVFEKVILRFKELLFLIASLLLVPAFCLDMPDPRMNTIGLTANYFGFGTLLSLLLVLSQKTKRWIHFFNKNHLIALIAWVGRYSYTIYLFHFLFGFGISSYIKKFLVPNSSRYFGFITYLLAAILVGYIVSQLVERPFLRLRDKWFPKNLSKA